MKAVFVDATYWIALLHPKDQDHRAARAFQDSLPAQTQLITSEMVLAELLDGLAKYGRNLREEAAKLVVHLQSRPNTEIVRQTSAVFAQALVTYRKFGDKKWGLTDCASFDVMRSGNITEALAFDVHFEQMGFEVPTRRLGRS